MKILVIRFSSIGDIVLTSPIVRCLKKQLDAKIHFLVKPPFKSLVRNNPNIDKVYLYERNVISKLLSEKYDLVIDLHHNLRSRKVKSMLGIKAIVYNKLNIQKWLKVNTPFDLLPNTHLVDRYFDALKEIGVENDGLGLDLYTDQESIDKANQITKNLPNYACLSLGANFYTKRIPIEKCLEIVVKSKIPILTIGGKDTLDLAHTLNKKYPDKVIDMCGKVSLQVSARLIHNAQYVITGDTGMMHIAAAYHKPIFTFWGNTIPAFGMHPYYGTINPDKNVNLEVIGLNCRPCSKLGFNKCPKGHFKCMKEIDISIIN